MKFVAQHFAKCFLFTATYCYGISKLYLVRLCNSKAVNPPAI